MIELLSEAVLATCCEEHRVGLESRIDQEIYCDQSEDGEKWACLWLQGFSLLARFKAFCLDLTVCCLQTAEQAPLDLLPCKQFIWFFSPIFDKWFESSWLKQSKKDRKILTVRRKLYLVFSPLFLLCISTSFPYRYTVIWDVTWGLRICCLISCFTTTWVEDLCFLLRRRDWTSRLH